jgi:bifunctional enzyme CysN/CysC
MIIHAKEQKYTDKISTISNDNSNERNIVVVGHVDDGKSTLIGQILFQTESLSEHKTQEIQKICSNRGSEFEWSFILDSFQAERNQGITIDITKVTAKSINGDINFIDVPGHFDFIKNMISGASQANCAVLIIDAFSGIREQTKRHLLILSLIGITKVVIALNKMDLVSYSEEVFHALSKDTSDLIMAMGLELLQIVPISAKYGENICTKSENLSWYQGESLFATLDKEDFSHSASIEDELDMPLIIPIQDVYKFEDKRIIAGKIEKGSFCTSDELVVYPSGRKFYARELCSWPSVDCQQAIAGENVSIQIDAPIFIERGDIISKVASEAPVLSDMISIKIFWLNETPIISGNNYVLQCGTLEVLATVISIKSVVDLNTAAFVGADKISLGQCGEIIIKTNKKIIIYNEHKSQSAKRIILKESFKVVGAGAVQVEDTIGQQLIYKQQQGNIFTIDHRVARVDREKRNLHKAGVVWLTGLSAVGKSTLAMGLENELFYKGCQVYVLDGDNIRNGLNNNLGFSPEDRSENIRRIAEAAKLMADAGVICIVACISPYIVDRNKAREIVGNSFLEIYIKADLEICELRDPKGLYKKARAGEISNFTGISAPYEAPISPELQIDTGVLDVDSSLNILLDKVLEQCDVLGS